MLSETHERNLLMTQDQFNTCLLFYTSTKSGPIIPESTRSLASNVIVNQDTELAGHHYVDKAKARALAKKVQQSFDTLVAWDACGTRECKYAAYTLKSIKKPSQGAFNAAIDIIESNGTITIYKASIDNGVNYECVKVILPRVQRYINYARLLKTLL